MYIREATEADAPAIAAVHVASWRTSYVGIVPDEVLARLSADERAVMWARRLHDANGVCTFVAVNDAGAIVGFADGGPIRDRIAGYAGELYGIYLLKEAQGHGAGRALVRAVADNLAVRGMTAMTIWVLSDNRPARGFYAALGGREIATKMIEIGGRPLEETAYGWADTAAIRAG